MGVCRRFTGAGVVTLEHTSKYTQKYREQGQILGDFKMLQRV